MSAFDLLKELTTQLSLSATGGDVGCALFGTSKHFGFATALIVDSTELSDNIGPAIVFSSQGCTVVEEADEKASFARHPFTARARASERPFVMSQVRDERGGTDEEWWSQFPSHLKQMDGVVVPVHDQGALAWHCRFAGRQPDLSQRTLSVMGAAVHAGYARFKELLDATISPIPLTPRETECLGWVAEGKTDSEVGLILKISARTVRFHINNAKVKLGVATRIQAVAKRVSGTA